jgi:ADP-ribose pyrophosphatase YjhB (NUDIX family)
MRMIQDAYPTVTVIRLMDQPSDSVWTNQLDTLIELVAPYGAKIYTGRDGFKSRYHGKHKLIEVTFNIDNITASEIRKQIKMKGERAYVKNRDAFRAGQIYQMQHLTPRTYTTVDMAMVNNLGMIRSAERILDECNYEILLCRKSTDPVDKYRLPGGFVDAGETFAQAAAREMREETTLHSEHGWDFVGDFMIDDWRVRGESDVAHRTVLMLGHYIYGSPIASDDIVETKWFSVLDLSTSTNLENRVIQGHYNLVYKTIQHLALKHQAAVHLEFRRYLHENPTLIQIHDSLKPSELM